MLLNISFPTLKCSPQPGFLMWDSPDLGPQFSLKCMGPMTWVPLSRLQPGWGIQPCTLRLLKMPPGERETGNRDADLVDHPILREKTNSRQPGLPSSESHILPQLTSYAIRTQISLPRGPSSTHIEAPMSRLTSSEPDHSIVAM